MLNLTTEQQAIVNAVMSPESDGKIVAVQAVAGSGKTSTAAALCSAYGQNNLYTAFNRGIVQDSKRRLKNADVRTIHSLAYKYTKCNDVANLTFSCIEETNDYEIKSHVLHILEQFCLSSHLKLDDYLPQCSNDKKTPEAISLVRKYLAAMWSGDRKPTYNFLLKYLHWLLANGMVVLTYDMVLLDECQDTTAVTLEIFKHIQAKKKVILGDTFQNIYAFMNTVNAFNLLDNQLPFKLTNSFRCNTDVANIVQTFGAARLAADFVYNGKGTSNSNTTAYLSRCNASLISVMINLNKAGTRYRTIRPLKEIFEGVIALSSASSGKPVYSAKYKFFETEFKEASQLSNVSFIQHLRLKFEFDVEVQSIVSTYLNITQKHGMSVFDLLKESEKMLDPKAITVLSTVHSFKGLEVGTAIINEDMNVSIDKAISPHNEDITEEEIQQELNLYYVALTRAEHTLVGNRY